MTQVVPSRWSRRAHRPASAPAAAQIRPKTSVRDRPTFSYDAIGKRCFDVCLSLVLLVALSPVLLVAMLAIRLESGGPVIFSQVRVGQHGRRFVMYKLRTMMPDRRKANANYSGPERRRHHKTRTDPRVTRVGRVLRRASLDELPQLVNVLRGDMSMVGPRPELPKLVAGYAPWQHERHQVKPGITGWWQISGRSDRPMHEHSELDIYYVRNRSFRLDLLILLRTIPILIARHGAF
jgi:exopolysaccharide biosynthesis polyprenyl glycosylphosphotransferase